MIIPYSVVVDVIHVADMDEAYGTYAADDKYFDNHDYDDDTDDDNDHKNYSYTAAGAGPLVMAPLVQAPRSRLLSCISPCICLT